MVIKFWGVRGSLPTSISSAQVQSKINAVIQRITPEDLESSDSRQRFIAALPDWLYGTVGGNTPCVQITTDAGDVIILDCGSGMRRCGKALAGISNSSYHIFISHFHWDHLQGLPFFEPAFNPSNKLSFYSSFHDIHQYVALQMERPYFPVQMDASFTKNTDFLHIEPGLVRPLCKGVEVISKFMTHPGGSYAYAFLENGHKFIYATDVELKNEDFLDTEENQAFFSHADILLLDSQYTLEEAIEKENWGHSAFCYAIDFAVTWNIQKIYLFHHEPCYDDKKIYSILEVAQWYADYASGGNLEVFMAVEDGVITL